jgi:RND family efflux transporter MFP subunit
MNKWPLLLIVVILAALPLLTACSPMSEPVAQAAVEQAETVVSVQVAPATSGDIAQVYEYTGDLQSVDSVTVLPGASGRVEAVLVEVGQQLQAGDPIAKIETDTYAVQLQQAQASLEAARLQIQKMDEGTRPEQIAAAQAAVQFARDTVEDVNSIDDDERTAAAAALAQAESALKLAQSEYDKVAWAGQVGMLPQSIQLEQATIGYEAALAAYELQTNPSDSQIAPLLTQLAQAEMALALAEKPFTETDYDLARTQVALAETAVEMAQIQMDEATIKAPFDGTVAEIYITQGSMVGPSVPVILFVSDQVEVVVDVEESRIARIESGLPASLRVSAYPDQDFPAVVTSVAPVADSGTHTFAVTVSPADGNGRLRSGMYAKVALLVDEKASAVQVPRQAVVEEGESQLVYVLTDSGTVEKRVITTGIASNGNVEVLSGLTAGEQVVIAGQADLEDGTSVEVKNPS